MRTYIILLTSLILALSISSDARAHDYEIVYFDEQYQSDESSDIYLNAGRPPVPVPLNHITDTLSDDTVGHFSDHQIGFMIPQYEFQPYGLLRGRQVVMTFPGDFDVSTVTSVVYHDTDEPSRDPQIERVSIYSHSVVVLFDEDLKGPDGEYFVYLTLSSIKNPTTARAFNVVVKVDNRLGQTIAGPDFSEPFYLEPDKPDAVRVSPSEDLYLTAGTGVQFSGEVVDEYGNVLAGLQPEWSLNPELDNIGTFYDAFLLATTLGAGQVRANYGDLWGSSGIITVTHGPASAIMITNDPDTVSSGEPLGIDIAVEILDNFGNRVTDYTGSIWFESDDSEAEIVYDEENPYQFTEEDQGRKIFAGDQFIFKTPGARILIVTDGSLSAANENIVVLSDGLVHFDISYPIDMKAGQPFELVIDNAIDGDGNPFTGRVYASGGNIAPDGTPPIVPDILIFGGSGSSQVWLFAAGENILDLSVGDYHREALLEVKPGDLGEMEVVLPETQYLGHPFAGAALLTVYDRYENLKTDISSSGIDFSFESDKGQITPELIPSDQFIPGEASIGLSEFVYSGPAGRIDLTVLALGIGYTVAAEVQFYANGLRVDINDKYHMAPMIPLGWESQIRGDIWNPADQAPVLVTYTSGFKIDDTITPGEEYKLRCIPEPFGANRCALRITRQAEVEPGIYEYITTVMAHYEIDSDTIITAWADTVSVEVVPFTDFTLQSIDLPAAGFPASYTAPASVRLLNENSFTFTPNLSLALYIIGEDKDYYLSDIYVPFGWEQEVVGNFTAQFYDLIPVGQYHYQVRVFITAAGADIGYLRYQASFDLDEIINISERGTYSVMTESISPTAASPNQEIAFTFDLNLSGSFPVQLNGQLTTLSVTDGDVTGSARLELDQYELSPGAMTLSARPIFIPQSWQGKSLIGKLRVVGIEAGLLGVDTTLEFDFPLNIGEFPALQVLSLYVEAPNAPYVNVGQKFGLVSSITNLSALNITEEIVVRFLSNGDSFGESGELVIELSGIAANDTIVLTQPVFADSLPNPLEEFTVTVDPIDDVEILPPRDDQAVIVIQKAVSVDLSPAFVNIPGMTPMIDYTEQFSIQVTFENFDRSRIYGGKLQLDYPGPGYFGTDFPSVKPFDSLVVWQLTAPSINVTSSFYLVWKEAPVDLNTGEMIDVSQEPIEIPFVVRKSVTRLEVVAESTLGTRPLQRGVASSVLRLMLTNSTNDVRNTVELQWIMIGLIDKDGNKIDGQSLVDSDGYDFYLNGQPAGAGRFINGQLGYDFSGAVLYPGDEVALELFIRPRQTAGLDFFAMKLKGGSISGQIINGPRTGQPVPVTGLGDQPLDLSFRQAIIAETLEESFKNYPNPFDPGRGGTEFKYFLGSDSDVDIYIFTVTGEKVREMHFEAGSSGGMAGPNLGIFWDGRNGEGDIVLNGVYIALIEVAATGQQAKLKMAVVK